MGYAKVVLVAGTALGLFLLTGTVPGATPSTVAIGGFLSDDAGKALEGVYTFRIELYSTGAPLVVDTVDTSATLVAGTFNLKVPVSERLLGQEAMRYRVWADVDRNGLTESDRFPDEFAMAPVGAANRGGEALKISDNFAPDRTANYNNVPGQPPQIMVGVLDVPAQGARLNTITAQIFTNEPAGFRSDWRYEIGVYDSEGKLEVKTSMLLRGLPSVPAYVQIVVPETRLSGGQSYTAFSSNVESTPSHFIYYTYSSDPEVDPFKPRSVTTEAAPGGVLPPSISRFGGQRTHLYGPALAVQLLPEAAALPVGAYRTSLDNQWVLPDGTPVR